MKTSILQENLHKGASRASRIVSTKPQVPVLSNLLLLATEGGFQIVSSSLETTEKTTMSAKVDKVGGVCVPARVFTELISSLPQDTVFLEEKGGSLSVSCGSVKATVAGIDKREFPPVLVISGKPTTTVEREVLAKALSLVLFAAATDEGRPLLTGVKLTQKKEKTILAATDGYRLSVYNLSLGFADKTEAVIPARALVELVRVCQEEKETKEIEFFPVVDGQLSIRIGETEIITRQVEGQYPNYEKIVPAGHTTSATLDTQELLRAVRSASIFARDSANVVRFHVNKKTVTVSANTPQVGEGAVEIDAKIVGEEGGDIAFNSRFLVDLLSVFPGEEVVLEMTGSLNPGVFRSPTDPAFLHIIMPVRVALE
ncbi:MAG: DNA polymerase III subunit beta [Patescibacteria group bacterium]|mgnify:CR=1 FL=1